MTRFRPIVIAFAAAFLLAQIAIPVLVMVDRSPGSTHRFGWQMFSENPQLAELEYEDASATRHRIDISDHVRKVRIDVDYASAAADFCRLLPDAVAIYADGVRSPC